MRELSPEEMELVAGGVETLNGMSVTDLAGFTVVPDNPYDSGNSMRPVAAASWSDSGNSANGSAGGDYAAGASAASHAVHHYTSPGGHSFSTHAILGPSQVSTAGQIIDFGIANYKTYGQYTALAVNMAFAESSLGTIDNNPTHFGLYQYSHATWADRHAHLNIWSQTDQIKAFYHDLHWYGQRYTYGHNQTAEIPWNIAFDAYVEIKHHAGAYSQDWNTPFVQEFYNKVRELGYGVE